MVVVLLTENRLDASAVLVALKVVVAVHEQLLHAASVRRLAIGKHGVPGARNGLKFLNRAAVRHVAADEYAVDAAVPVPFERLREHLLAGERKYAVIPLLDRQVDVAQDAEHEVRTPPIE